MSIIHKQNQIIDACCLLNIIASQYSEEILLCNSSGYFIPGQVINEVKYIREFDPDTPDTFILKKVDITNLVDANCLKPCSLETDSEYDLFIELATKIDDGEAACLALASERKLEFVSDDRKAIIIAQDLGVSTLSTPDILKDWGSLPNKSEILPKALVNIQTFACFQPSPNSLLYEWWEITSGDNN